MMLRNRWLVPVAFVGVTAAILAIGLFWALMTRPVAAAEFLGSAF